MFSLGYFASLPIGTLTPLAPCSSSTGHQVNLGTVLPWAWAFLNVNEHSCHSQRILKQRRAADHTVIRETSPQEGEHWSYRRPCVSGSGSQCRQDAAWFWPTGARCFPACGEHGCEWVAMPAAPARCYTNRAHEPCNRMYPAQDGDITVLGLFIPGQPDTAGCLASKMPVGCCLPGEEAHAAQPARGEDRPLARAGRLMREADPI